MGVANGMALLEAQQASARRSAELLLEAEVEKAKLQAISDAHFEVDINNILNAHAKASAAQEMKLALDKERHKTLLNDRLRRRRRTRQAEHEKRMEQVAVATPVDLETDLKFAEVQLQECQNIADSIMLEYVASQKAMAEELERETELHHSHLSDRLKARRAHRKKVVEGQKMQYQSKVI